MKRILIIALCATNIFAAQEAKTMHENEPAIKSPKSAASAPAQSSAALADTLRITVHCGRNMDAYSQGSDALPKTASEKLSVWSHSGSFKKDDLDKVSLLHLKREMMRKDRIATDLTKAAFIIDLGEFEDKFKHIDSPRDRIPEHISLAHLPSLYGFDSQNPKHQLWLVYRTK